MSAMTTEAALPIKLPKPLLREYRQRSPNLSVSQLSPAMAEKIQNIRSRKWGSCPEPEPDVWTAQYRLGSVGRMEAVSDSSEDGGAEESIHPSHAGLPQEDVLGGASSPGVKLVGSVVSDDSCIPFSRHSASSEQTPPPSEAAKDNLTRGPKANVLPGTMESLMSSSETFDRREWAASPDMDSVTLSNLIENLIQQVSIGVLTTDAFFTAVKDLIEDYIYVECNVSHSPQYEEVPHKRLPPSSSHIYLDILPHPIVPPQSNQSLKKQTVSSARRNGRVLPRSKTESTVRMNSKENSPINRQRMSAPNSNLQRSQSVPSLFASDVQLKPHMKRSLSSSTSMDQDGYSVVKHPSSRYRRRGSSSYDLLYATVKHVPPALPPRSFAKLSATRKRPLPLPPRISRGLPNADTSPALPLRVSGWLARHPNVDRQFQIAVEPSLPECDEPKHPSTNSVPVFHPPVRTHGQEESSSPLLGREPQRKLSASPVCITVSNPPTYEGLEVAQQPLGAVSVAKRDVSASRLSDPAMPEIFPFSPPVHGQAIRQPDVLARAKKESSHSVYDTESDDDSEDMVNVSEVVRLYKGNQIQPHSLDLASSGGLVRRSASLDDVSTPSSEYTLGSFLQPAPLPLARSTEYISSIRPEQHSRLYGASGDALSRPKASNASEDDVYYTIPPDAVVGYVEPLFSQPMQSYFQFLQMANVNHSAQSIHMEGLLTVRPRKGVKKERYFILHKMELRMHAPRGSNTPKNVARSLQKTYRLDQWCQIKFGSVQNGFVLVTEEEEVELSAPSSLEYYRWVEMISQALKSTQTPKARHQQSRSTIKGYLHVVINGLTFKCFGAISDRHLNLYGTAEDEEPFYTLPLETVVMSTENEMSLPGQQLLYPKPIYDISGAVPPIHLHGNGSSVYLLFKTLQEYGEWHYYLCLDGDMESPRCTPLEGLIRNLRRGETRNADVGGGESSTRGKGIPLTTMPSFEWEEAATEMFKHIEVFMSTPLMSAAKLQTQHKGGMSYFATFVHNIIEKCLKTRQLRNEFYCQLINLIAKHSDSGSMEALQGWLLLAITIPFFLPLKSKFLWYLEQHINKYLNSKFPQVAAFAECCQAKLARAVVNKERACRPAFCELLYLLPQFPKPPSTPIVKDVVLSTGDTVSVSFDSSSTVQEVVSQINQELGLPPSNETGFSLACDWPGLEDAHISLHPSEKILDVISAWNDSLTSISGQSCLSRYAQFVYCSRVYFQARAGREDSKEAFLLAHQVNQEVVNSRIQVDLETAKELSSLMLHVEYGNFNQYPNALQMVREVLWKYFPTKETRRILDLDRRQHVDSILSLWSKLRNVSKEECIQLYLQRVRRIPAFGFRYFQVTRQSLSGSSRASIAVGEDCIQVMSSSSSRQSTREFPYHMVESFGASGTDFMLYINDKAMGIQEKMMFGMPQILVQELTFLIASYMEMFLKTSATQPPSSMAIPGSNMNPFLPSLATI